MMDEIHDPSGGGSDEHLKYLLTAYLFGDLSEAGRKEVARHLSACTACCAQLAEMRAVLADATDALRAPPAGPQPYAFEERRIERILAAGAARPARRRRRMQRWFAAAAAVATVAFIGLFLLRTATTWQSKSARHEKANYLPHGYEFASKPPASGARIREISPAEYEAVGAIRDVNRTPLPAPSFPAPVLHGATEGPGSLVADRDENAAMGEAGGEGTFSTDFDGNPIAMKNQGKIFHESASSVRTEGLELERSKTAEEPVEGSVLALGHDTSLVTVTGVGEEPASDPTLDAGRLEDTKSETAIESYEVSDVRRTDAGSIEALRAGIAGNEEMRKQTLAKAEQVVDELERNGALEADRERSALTASPVATPAAPPPVGEPAGALKDHKKRAETKELSAGGGAAGATRGLVTEPVEFPRIPGRRKAEVNVMLPADPTLAFDPSEIADKEKAPIGGENGDSVGVTIDANSSFVGQEISQEDDEDAPEDMKFYGKEKSFRDAAREKPQGDRQAGLLEDEGGRYGWKESSDAARPLDAAQEEAWRAYNYYHARDPQMSVQSFRARPLAMPRPAIGDEGLGEEQFRKRYGVNPFVDTQRDHLSTFAMDVDTASYTRARALLNADRLPNPADVRVEEFVNYFRQEYPADPARAFSVFCEGGPAPFGANLEQVKVTVKARELAPGERRNAVLTFAIDASGSMLLEGRIAKVKYALATLLNSSEIRADDRIAVVAYGAQPYLVLPHTPARERGRILGSIASIAATGSTNVESGLDLAYRIAVESFHEKAQNRVILCTDGVATAGARSAEQVLDKVKVFARRGIYLSIVGFGRRQYDDAFLERIANQGNGNYSYVDSREEAARIFIQNLPAMLNVLARDAKIQVDFDPQVVSHYRLLGYENRDIKDADFRNDRVDAGEVGPGSTVTALYEIRRRPATHGDLGKVQLRFHDTTTGRVEELAFPLAPGVLATRLADTSDGFRFIAAAAEFAELLRDSYWSRDGSYGRVFEVLASLSPAFRARPEWDALAKLVLAAQTLTIYQQSQRNAQ